MTTDYVDARCRGLSDAQAVAELRSTAGECKTPSA